MSRLPRLTGQEVVQALSRAGFEVLRQRGSHLFLKHLDGRATVVPIHSGEIQGARYYVQDIAGYQAQSRGVP